ncbi:MAG: hypothetical protein P8N76_12090 [Pirellulaceae bacterium]|nr:hypothetical protein [Pirellulaceae bacterium]
MPNTQPNTQPNTLLADESQISLPLASETAGWAEDASDETAAEDDSALTLLERLDRRQNQVMQELDALDQQVQQLVKECQSKRRQVATEEAA